FQAEDGIRDGHVTGVQTCALPISSALRKPADVPEAAGLRRAEAPAPGAEAGRVDFGSIRRLLGVALVQHLGTGRRKRAVARVFLRSGKGQITVNGRSFENYFPSEAARAIVRQPLLA